MTHRLDRMVERGLLARKPDPETRTRASVSLTRAGWELFRKAVLEAEREEAGIFAPLSDEERLTLAGLLEKALQSPTGPRPAGWGRAPAVSTALPGGDIGVTGPKHRPPR